MNKFDRAVNRKTSELISKNLLNQEVYEEDYKKFKTIARALVREELRNAKVKRNQNSLYHKTWKAAIKYGDFQR
jgi:hypothetical protein